MSDFLGLGIALGKVISVFADYITTRMLAWLALMVEWLFSIMGFDGVWSAFQLPSDSWLLLPLKIANALFPVYTAFTLWFTLFQAGLLIKIVRMVANVAFIRNK